MAFFSNMRRIFRGAAPAKPPYEATDIHLKMRALILKMKPADTGETDDTKILALVMDTGFAEAAFTLVATLDGSTSLYFSNGGGIIGAGEQPEGAAAAKELIAEAGNYVSQMTFTKEAPLAMPGMTTFYLITGKGLLSMTAKENDLGEGHHAVSPLFHKAHRLIGTIRSIDEKSPRKS